MFWHEGPSLICFILSAVLTDHLTMVSATAGLLSYQTAPLPQATLQQSYCCNYSWQQRNALRTGFICGKRSDSVTQVLPECTVCSPGLLYLQFIKNVEKTKSLAPLHCSSSFYLKTFSNLTVGTYTHSVEWVESHIAGTSHANVTFVCR